MRAFLIIGFILYSINLQAQFGSDAMWDFHKIVCDVLNASKTFNFKKVTFTERNIEQKCLMKYHCGKYVEVMQFQFINDSILQRTEWGGCPDHSGLYKVPPVQYLIINDQYIEESSKGKFEKPLIEKKDSAGYLMCKIFSIRKDSDGMPSSYEYTKTDSVGKSIEYIHYQNYQSIVEKEEYLNDSITLYYYGFENHPLRQQRWSKMRREILGDTVIIEVGRYFGLDQNYDNTWGHFVEEKRTELYYKKNKQLAQAKFIFTCPKRCSPPKRELILSATYE